MFSFIALKTVLTMVPVQMRIKLAKFTRRGTEREEIAHKVKRALEFVFTILAYDVDLVRRSRACLINVARRQVGEISLYGERHVIEIISQLAPGCEVKIARTYGEQDAILNGSMTIQDLSAGVEPILIASLVDADRKAGHLRSAGVEPSRIVVIR